MKNFALATGIALLVGTTLPAAAATIDPSDFDLIFTEGGRTTTIDGADISGNGANPDNSNIGRFDIGPLSAPMDILMAGRVGNTGRDQWEATGVSGWLQFDVLNYTARRSTNTDPFRARFEVIVNGTIAQSITLDGTNTDLLSASFTPILLDNDNLRLRVRSETGRSAYDISAALQPIPVAASFPLLLSAGGALAWAGRRKKRDT